MFLMKNKNYNQFSLYMNLKLQINSTLILSMYAEIVKYFSWMYVHIH